MRWLVWALLLFVAAVGIALIARFSNGNVAILWPPYKIDLSVNLALAIIAVGFLALHLVLVGISKAFAISEKVRSYRDARLKEKARLALSQGLLALFEGRYGRAERLAQDAQSVPETASLGALIAARAAHRMREYNRRDVWLEKAQDPLAANAKLMTQAELLTEEQKPAQALAAIELAQSRGSRHIYAQRLALKAYELSENWPEVLRITRLLDKRAALHDVVSAQLRMNAYRQLLRNADPSATAKYWGEIKSQTDIAPRLAAVFAQAFEGHGNTNAAQLIYEGQLSDSFNAPMLRRYLALNGVELKRRLSMVEKWQTAWGDEPELLSALGELCRKEKLWGKAQTYLETSINKKPTVAAHFALGQLFETLENSAAAAEQFRLGNALAVMQNPGLNV